MWEKVPPPKMSQIAFTETKTKRKEKRGENSI